MDDFDDGDYMDMDGFEWLYVEDEFELADELAEGVLPDPGYIVGYEIVEHDYDDLFNYGDDVEYGEDAYWDTAGPRPAPLRQNQINETTKTRTGSKRKRIPEKAPISKRQKRSTSVDRASQPVIYLSRETRWETYKRSPPILQKEETFALRPDWRERYKNTDGLTASKPMPPSMAKAAHEGDEEEELIEEEEGEEEGEASWESDEEGEESEGGLDIDPEQLKAILVQKMAEAGISGKESEASFMQSINDMLSGEGKGEAAMEMLQKAQASGGRKRKADSAVGLEPGSKRGKGAK